MPFKASSSENDSGSAGAAIGGAVGGAVFFIIIISLVLSVLLYVKCLRKRKSYVISVKSPFSRPNRGNYYIAQNVVRSEIIVLVHLEGKTLANLTGLLLHFNVLMIVGWENF